MARTLARKDGTALIDLYVGVMKEINSPHDDDFHSDEGVRSSIDEVIIKRRKIKESLNMVLTETLQRFEDEISIKLHELEKKAMI
jgi:hypothetical protein